MGVPIKTQMFETEAGKPFLQRGIRVCITSKQLTKALLPLLQMPHGEKDNISSQFVLVKVSQFRIKETRRGLGSPGWSSTTFQDAVGRNSSPCHGTNAWCFATNRYLMNN